MALTIELDIAAKIHKKKMIDMLGDVGMPVTHDDMEHIEHRIYHDYVGSADF